MARLQQDGAWRNGASKADCEGWVHGCQRSRLNRIALDLESDWGTVNHPQGWCKDGVSRIEETKMGKMETTELKPKLADSEKITINLGMIDLGQIDLLVSEGFYANRTDLIRTAIRNQLNAHADVVKQTVARKSLVLGLHHYSRRDLEAALAAGERLQIQVLGMASIATDVSAELALATIDSIFVLGALHASAAVKTALAGRII
jgi:Arc/MetJ-type ribon-helix-helix transcriptional regulator